ncbi:MAG: hypothetical protein HONBIEJF_01815 [Fimbriimonadaceae bacterium]|nr:hypothetical protein [Fimbriimonadaceae bacterium]
MRGCLLVIVGVLLASGCAKQAPIDEPKASPTKTSANNPPPIGTDLDAQYESVRAGLVLVDSAVEGLEELLTMVKELQPKLRGEAVGVAASVREAIDSAGSLVSEIDTDMPDRSTYEKEFATWDERRLAAITACNDALHELGEAGEGLATIGDIDAKHKPEIDDVLLALRLAEEDLAAGVVKLGGTVEQPEG